MAGMSKANPVIKLNPKRGDRITIADEDSNQTSVIDVLGGSAELAITLGYGQSAYMDAKPPASPAPLEEPEPAAASEASSPAAS